jgi:hypothetical protein
LVPPGQVNSSANRDPARGIDERQLAIKVT